MTSTQSRSAGLLSIALMLICGAQIASAQAFDHAPLNRALRVSVRMGRVNYAALRGNRDLEKYITSIASAKLAKLSRDERLTFWINAYNALVLRSVLDNPGIARPTDVKGFFDARKHTIAGRSLTLNEIENDVIRSEFKEPLIHFGLVCAAISCPQLPGAAYESRTIRTKLAENARRYLASPENVADQKRRVVSLSKIFDWYKADFGGDAGLRAFLAKYAPMSFTQVLRAGGRIEYRTYDWRLNAIGT